MANGISYVKGFVGVFGRRASTIQFKLPQQLNLTSQLENQGVYYKLVSFGSTSSSLPESIKFQHAVWIKGRPFSLSVDCPLVALNPTDPRSVDTVLANVDGKFSLFIASPHGTAICATDLLGAGSLYYCEVDEHLYFSTHLGILLCSSQRKYEYDQLGIASLLVASAPIDGTTPFQHIRRLRHCECIVANALTSEGSRSIDWSVRKYMELKQVLTKEEHKTERGEASLEHFSGLLRDSLNREGYAERIGVMLSSGRDSRALALALRKDFGVPIEAVTFGTRWSTDLLGAKATAAKLRVPHHAVPYDWWDFSTYGDRIVGLGGGMSGLQTAHMLPGFEFASDKFRVCVVGYLGDAATGAHLPKSGDVGFEDVLQTTFPHLFSGTDVPVRLYYPNEVDTLIETLRGYYNSMQQLAPHQRALVCDWTIRQASWMSQTFDLCESFVEVSYPFFYRPLLRFMFNLPLELLQGQRLYDSWIAGMENEVTAEMGGTSRVWERDVVWSRWAQRILELRPTGRMKRLISRVPYVSPVQKLDWHERVGRSTEWLSAQIKECCEDERARELCHRSLERASRHRFPLALLALAPYLVRRYCV